MDEIISNMNDVCIHIEFCGEKISKDDLRKNVQYFLIEFTGEKMHLDHLIFEITKNIYDHANGLGYLSVTKMDNVFFFEVADYGTKSHDLDSLKKGVGWTRKNEHNYGLGLGIISDMSEDLGIDLHIDTSKGFRYWGIYKQNHSLT